MVHKYVYLTSSALTRLLYDFEAPVMCKNSLFWELFGQFIKRGCRTEATITGEIGFFKRWDCHQPPNSRILILLNSLPVRMRSKNKSFLQQIEHSTTRDSGRTFHPLQPIHHHHRDRVTPNHCARALLPHLLRFVFSRFRQRATGSLGSTCSLGFCRLLFNAKLFWLFRGPCIRCSLYSAYGLHRRIGI